MKKENNRFSIMLLLALISVVFSTNSYGKTCKWFDGIYYSVWSGGYADVERYPYLNGNYTGDIIIPRTVGDYTLYTVKYISNGAFKNSSITSISLPTTIKKIWDEAFMNCKSLKSIILESEELSINKSAFYGCKLLPLQSNHLGFSKEALNGLDPTSIVLVPNQFVQSTKQGFENTYSNTPLQMTVTPYYKGFNIKFTHNEGFESIYGASENIVLRIKDGSQVVAEFSIYDGLEKVIDGLSINSTYNLEMSWIDSETQESIIAESIYKTNDYKPSYSYSNTQTTISFEWSFPADATVNSVGNKKVLFNGKYYELQNNKIIFDNLKPNTNFDLKLYCTIDGNSSSFDYSVRTKSITFSNKGSNLSPTAIDFKGQYNAGDAVITKSWLETSINNQVVEADSYLFSGLLPNTKYSISLFVITDKGYTFSNSYQYTTPNLELVTLQPQCASSSVAIVSATTNISDLETNVGFQWKKYDAPESLKPSEGYSNIYNGILEGRIINLQPTSYYNVRAFYKSANNQYYYSDWITFDPSDFSYLEPTIYTYPTVEVTPTSASVRVFAIAGTDDIIDIGVQYWPTENNNYIESAQRIGSNSQSITVEPSGTITNIQIPNLSAESTYSFRAFVTTAKGIFYGKDQSFTTAQGESGIDQGYIDVVKENSSIVGYYDISGRKHLSPIKGLNIVLYSDGSYKKVIMK